jgi:hypothetical protein
MNFAERTSVGEMSFRFIDQHTRRNVVDEIARRNSDHRHGFFIPQMYDTAFDNFAGLRFEADGRA